MGLTKSTHFFFPARRLPGSRQDTLFTHEADFLEMLSGWGAKSGLEGMFCFFIFSSKVVRLRWRSCAARLFTQLLWSRALRIRSRSKAWTTSVKLMPFSENSAVFT